ncbi:MAG: glycerophosphodiester phosphodiesterase family protein [Steroidobacteraceae bacterium]
MRARRVVHLVAHRGNAAEFPENTLPGVISAFELGLRFAEIDVQISRDGVPVVIHDHMLTRTAALNESVLEMSAAEITAVDAAETARFGDRFAGLKVPLLSEMIKVLGNYPQAVLFIEIKRASLARFGHDQVVGNILDVIRPYRSQCVLISFDLPAVFRARQQSGVRIGWVLSEYDSHTQLKCEALRPEFLFCDHHKLPGDAAALWRGTWKWVIYEIAELSLAVELARRGADYIETMRVRAMSREIRRGPDGE